MNFLNGFEPLDSSSYPLSKTRIFFAIENTKILNNERLS